MPPTLPIGRGRPTILITVYPWQWWRQTHPPGRGHPPLARGYPTRKHAASLYSICHFILPKIFWWCHRQRFSCVLRLSAPPANSALFSLFLLIDLYFKLGLYIMLGCRYVLILDPSLLLYSTNLIVEHNVAYPPSYITVNYAPHSPFQYRIGD